MLMHRRDLNAKQSLAKASEAIRRKFQHVRSAHMENKRILEEQYKPITKRLGQLIDTKQQKISSIKKKKNNNDDEDDAINRNDFSATQRENDQLHQSESLRWDSMYDFVDSNGSQQIDFNKKMNHEMMMSEDELEEQTKPRRRKHIAFDDHLDYGDADDDVAFTSKRKPIPFISERDRKHTKDFRNKQRFDVGHRYRQQRAQKNMKTNSSVIQSSVADADDILNIQLDHSKRLRSTDESDVDNAVANRTKLSNVSRDATPISISSESSDSILPAGPACTKKANKDKRIRNRLSEEARNLYHDMTEKRNEKARINANRSANLYDVEGKSDAELLSTFETTKHGKLSERAAIESTIGESETINILEVTPHTSKRSRHVSNNIQEEEDVIIESTMKQKQKARDIRDRIAEETRDFYHEKTHKRDEELRVESRRDPNLYLLKAQEDANRLLSSPIPAKILASSSTPKYTPLIRNSKSVLMSQTEYEESRDVLSEGDEQGKSTVKKKQRKKKTNDLMSNIRKPYARKLRSDKTHVGDGLIDLSMKQYKIDNSSDSYTYWNDPNELVVRLRLLIASTTAGNNAHQNEILSIIEELREADIIE